VYDREKAVGFTVLGVSGDAAPVDDADSG